MASSPGNEKALQTHIQGMEGDLETAINALRRLQAFTGSLVEKPGSRSVVPDQRLQTAIDATIETTKDSDAILGTVDSLPRVAAESEEKVRELSVGESFGRYQISRPLGRGNMGAVYLAYDSQLERHVALKTPFFGQDPVAMKRFYREARSAAQIRSPYVCPIYEVGDVSGILYLTMAFIEGKSLAKWIEIESYSIDAIVPIFRKISLGLQKAHGQSIIHRDLKPDNIMIDEDGEPIIMDFGLARRADDNVRLTSSGGLLGTPAYMSPEQVRGNQDEVGPQSDIYSLGVVLYEIITGTVPFGGSLTSLLYKVVHEHPVPPSERQPQLPTGSNLECLCLKMLSKTTLERYSCIEEVVAALDDIGGPKEPEPDPVQPASRFDAARQRLRHLRDFIGTRVSSTQQSPPSASEES